MKRFVKEYFNYSKNEVRGILVLIVLILIVFTWPIFSKHYQNESNTNFDSFKKQLTQFETDIQVEDKELVTYFSFDPNSVSRKDLLKLGLKENQAQTLINYRKAGGVFVKPEDLKDVYTINDVLYCNLKPYIRIKPVDKNSSISLSTQNVIEDEPNISYSNNYEVELIELNKADTIDLIKLYGIGPVLASRIIKYKILLGGYVNSNQLLEVYGLNSETYSLISSNIIIDTIRIQKININSASFKLLNGHPYIDYSDTKAIVKYRELMGSFLSIDELVTNNLIDSVTYNKVKYYLNVE